MKEPTLYEYDYLLTALADLMARGDLSIGITLVCDGVFVSGRMVSQEEYFQILASTIADGATSEKEAQSFRYIFTMTANRISTDGMEPTVRAEKNLTVDDDPIQSIEHSPPRTFIHLKQVSIMMGQQVTRIPVWRGRVTSVSAWFPGELGQQKY